MVDALGWRRKFAVIAPSTNTSVQPEFDDMRPRGVTNHFARIWIPDDLIHDDADFEQLMRNIRAGVDDAIDRVMTCRPEYLLMGMSSETFWAGAVGSRRSLEARERRAGVPVAMGSYACQAAFEAYGGIKRIAVITPYMPVGDAQVVRFFTDCGYEVVRLKGLKCESPVLIAHVQADTLEAAIDELDGADVDAIVQVGTNLVMARLAGEAERRLRKPVIAINTAIYWYALRQNGLSDKVDGFGELLSRF